MEAELLLPLVERLREEVTGARGLLAERSMLWRSPAREACDRRVDELCSLLDRLAGTLDTAEERLRAEVLQ